MAFFLEKWYADCVTPAGDVLIAYAASLQWLGVRIRYMGAIDDQGRASGTFRWGSKLELDPQGANWDLAVGHRTGTYDLSWKTTQPVSSVAPLLVQGTELVAWQPLAVFAQVVEKHSDRPVGTGYIERLCLTIKPWDLGLHILRWGRWIGSQHTLTWVEWEGRHPRRVAILNGHCCSLVNIGPTRVFLENGCHLAFGTPKVLVHARLGEDALRIFSYLPGLIPRPFLDGVECKYLAPATLTCGNSQDEGWAIYEEVIWPAQ
ncbi:MAG TPA: hypothetical protein PLL06_01410 [Acidobacteriota bacterium]|nr:hypothetical protein [Acidobacteriota bacterium]HMZ78327.1 hypothetical protein [Acidobacteriota bacterium]HNB70785.1 hypothetical protein [Acidobacteriota bacterium]HNG92880.1 hypothetical protein [Acidobacteriota bacterium]